MPLQTKPKYADVYAMMCLIKGQWTRVGKIARTREQAQEWLHFAKAGTGATKSKVDRVRLYLCDDGKPTEESRRKMLEKYNVEMKDG